MGLIGERNGKANGTHGTNGTNGTNGHQMKLDFDPTFTDSVISATGPKANARLAEIVPSLLRHMHDFAREVNLTMDEWMAAIDMVRVGLPRGDMRTRE